MHHCLFVAEQRILEIRILLESLPYTADISMSEDAEAACKKANLSAVSLDILILEEANDALRDC